MRSAARTDVGLVRSNNEDALFASPRLVAVADGVGGAAAGEVASRVVIDALAAMEKTRLETPLPEALETAARRGNETLAFIADCRPQLRGMSTTLTAVAIDEGYVVANIGDSRTYLLRDGELLQLTRDDSLVQELIEAGRLDARDARAHPHRSVVLAALDGDPERSATVARHEAQAGDRLLLCSDGLSDLVEEDVLRDALASASREEAADALVGLALDAGGRDNVSVIVADVVAVDGEEGGW